MGGCSGRGFSEGVIGGRGERFYWVVGAVRGSGGGGECAGGGGKTRENKFKK